MTHYIIKVVAALPANRNWERYDQPTSPRHGDLVWKQQATGGSAVVADGPRSERGYIEETVVKHLSGATTVYKTLFVLEGVDPLEVLVELVPLHLIQGWPDEPLDEESEKYNRRRSQEYGWLLDAWLSQASQ